jgi:hypothetical protein
MGKAVIIMLTNSFPSGCQVSENRTVFREIILQCQFVFLLAVFTFINKEKARGPRKSVQDVSQIQAWSHLSEFQHLEV